MEYSKHSFVRNDIPLFCLVLVTEENLLSWQEEEKELILEKSKNARPTWQENYVSLLMQYDQLQ